MEKIKGEIISSGIALGILKLNSITVDIEELITNSDIKICSDDVQRELDIYQKAISCVMNYYSLLCEKASARQKENNDEDIAAIFEGLGLVAADEELMEAVNDAIKEDNYTAEYAVYKVSRMFISSLESVDDVYIKQRAKDIEEVSNKLINNIIDIKNGVNTWQECNNYNDLSLNNTLPHILIVDKLFPELLLGDNQINIKGVVARKCGENSHAAIIARTLEIPVLLIGAHIKIEEGSYGILDCEKGELISNPTEEIKESYINLITTMEEDKESLKMYKDVKAITKSGKNVAICANVSGIKDIEAAIENCAEGIGLFRSELLYMEREMAPTEKEQFLIYKEAATLMNDKPLIIRVFDAGMDKELKFFRLTNDKKQSIEQRGISVLLKNLDIFKTQLRAIYRASNYGNISVMFPMISSVDEMSKVQEILREVKMELETENIPFKEVKVGIMVETPSAVKYSDILTENIDFVSIGTNDLIQYTFSKDRTSEHSLELNAEEYEKLFGMIKITVDNAHKNNCKVSVCGELAGDLNYTDKLLQTGVDELSVAPSKILLLRKQISGLEKVNL